MSDTLLHYGTPRKSGRYPWGSGKDPQRNKSLAVQVKDLKKQGKTEKDIAADMGMTTTELRRKVAIANEDDRKFRADMIPKMREYGMTNTAIAKELGMTEGSVRNYMTQKEKVQKTQISNVADALKGRIEDVSYLDIGAGTEIDMGISRTKLRNAVKLLEDEGYHTHKVYVPQIADKNKKTTVLVLTKEPDVMNVVKNSDKIRSVQSWTDDGGTTMQGLKPFVNLSFDKVKIRYAEDGGEDKDGVIELNRKNKDLDLGASRYAQVRIGVNGTHYLKGMAMYGDVPDKYDVVFNTNKPKGTPKEKVLKGMKDNPDNPFGTSIIRQKGALNVVNEEGTWKTWSSKLSAQMLSKQPLPLIKDRLDNTMGKINKDVDELNSLTNPIVKKHLMSAYADGLTSKTSHLKVEGLPRSENHVLLPFPDMKPGEVYAPNYKNGEKVVLVRYPHGGTFEIPELTVNNRQKSTKGITNAIDAIGIHPSVGQKLSGADFDGDTVMVIPNNRKQVKASRSLKELKNFDPNSYKVDHKTIKPQQKQHQMGKVSNLITDMTIKGASQGEIARAVKHSMVVIDSEKHNLDWKQSARDNGIQALHKKYQTHINPLTGKKTVGGSTIISKSKKYVDTPDGKKPILEAVGDAHKLSSGTARENLYADYMNKVTAKKNALQKTVSSIPPAKRDPHAAKKYAPEVESLRAKVDRAASNAPKERQAQLLATKTYYDKLDYEMSKDEKKRLKSQALGRARQVTGSNRHVVTLTPKEWEAIQSNAVTNNLLDNIMKYGDQDQIKQLATPKKKPKMSEARASKARTLLSRGYPQAEVAKLLGVSVGTIMDALE